MSELYMGGIGIGIGLLLSPIIVFFEVYLLARFDGTISSFRDYCECLFG